MSPDQNPAVRELLEARLDTLDSSIRDLGHELRKGQERIEASFQSQLDRIETQVRTTNGRVTRIELEEAAAKAVADDHRRMAVMQEGRSRQWIGLPIAILAGTCSGIAVVIFSLIVTGQI